MTETLINCPHKRSCNCLEKALALANKTRKDVTIVTLNSRILVTRKEKP